ncbi:mechanosensitive ion channel [Salinibacterium sp. G-O1]|uniref:mechanosensitive ion channel family protein n=1 Tax=Salinibacterium sp. G-O1 TaxID=3046208 RepID=UPI0024BB8358|nr:mechanosensitive ion channel domain-containing protein [Salinibacterium sp. G-O1]MDJ0335544.1 mechanosensitive ion channel [Salinibacterium sp. G-O1]
MYQTTEPPGTPTPWDEILQNLVAFDTDWHFFTIFFVIVGSLIVRWVLHFVIRRVVRRIINGAKRRQNFDDTQALLMSPLAAVRVVQRTRTLGSVLGNLVTAVIVIMGVLVIFNTVYPGATSAFALITAALGAGLGFGAQNIVKDVLSGLFMVAEDQLGVGDVVDLGPATGVVENVGIRITQVRDVNGTLWFVRNGEILRVGNKSQGWARVIIDLAVPYEVDVEAVQDRILQTASSMADSGKWQSRILEKPEIWGIESISAEAVVLRIVVKTASASKDDVARELRARLKSALDDMGVRLPALNTMVLSGAENAASVHGARPPKTKPVAVQSRDTSLGDSGSKPTTRTKNPTDGGPE